MKQYLVSDLCKNLTINKNEKYRGIEVIICIQKTFNVPE